MPEQNENVTQSSATTAKRPNGKWTSKESYDAIVDRGSDLLSRANTRTTEMVRQYPVQAALGGLVAGFLLGAIVARRKA